MRKPSLSASISTLLCIILLCGLGFWQIQRLHWKEKLLAQMDAAYAEKNPPALTFDQVMQQAGNGDDFTPVQLRGALVPHHEILLGVRTWQGQPGFHEIALLEMPGGGIVLVNRGWVPAAATGKTKPPPAPFGAVTITGILHRPMQDNPFVPQNDPKANLWYRWNLPQIAKGMNVDARHMAPLVVYEESESVGDQSTPVRAALRWDLPNNHLYYAWFWFTMAGVLAVIFFLRFVRK
jgi:surfeit locus 1 family protein